MLEGEGTVGSVLLLATASSHKTSSNLIFLGSKEETLEEVELASESTHLVIRVAKIGLNGPHD